MTREHKLALILGFSVLLVVGLLVGDHFSKAKRPVGAAGGDPSVASAQPGTVTPNNRINDPMNSAAPTPAGQGPGTPGTLAINDPRGGTVVEPIIMGSTNGLNGADNPLGNGVSPRVGTPANGTASIDELRRRLELMSNGQTNPPGMPGSAPGPLVGNTTTPPAVTPPSTPGPSAPLLPVSLGKEKLHPVEEGESLYAIAKNEYGDGNLWKDLAKYNGSRVKGDSVRAGVTLKLPPKDVLLGKAVLAGATQPTGVRVNDVVPPTGTPRNPTLGHSLVQPSIILPEPTTLQSAPKTYTVKAGDTLGAIAKATLGSSKRWEEILNVNSDKLESPEELKIGMVLKLPAK